MIQEVDISTIKSIQQNLLDGTFSCTDLVQYYLNKIKESEFTNAYTHVFQDEALEKAKALDTQIQKGEVQGKLFGLFISVKDVICVANAPTTASSKILSGYRSPFNATAVQRLLDEGAIIIGMTNCDEFGMGSGNENSYYGPVRNYDHQDYIPGGSSGGSAVSVQAGTCHISLGTDTGGSVRQPASFCNIIGFKPSYGGVSRYGLIAYASSFDQIGILGKNIDDISIVLETIEGQDEKDSTTVDRSTVGSRRFAVGSSQSAEESSAKKIKIAILNEAINTRVLQLEIKNSFSDMIEGLGSKDVDVSTVSFPLLSSVVSAYYILTTAEASSNLSRYDGVRYGFRSEKGGDLEEMYRHTRSEGFGPEVKRRIMLGTFVLSSGYYDAYFTRAQKVRRLIQEQVDAILEENEFIILPTTPTTAWKIGEKDQDPISVYLADVFTVIANLTGLPAISIPLGKDKNGLPFGLQVIGRRFQENNLLAFSKQLA